MRGPCKRSQVDFGRQGHQCSRCTTKVNFYYQHCVKVYHTEKWQHLYSKGRSSTDKHMVQIIENKETVVGDVKPSSPISTW